MNSDKDIVAAVRAALAERIGPHRYELWFGPETQLHYQGTILTIRVPNLFFQEWILANFRSALEASCQTVLGTIPQLVFELANGTPLASAEKKQKAEGTGRAKRADSGSEAAGDVFLPLFQGAEGDGPLPHEENRSETIRMASLSSSELQAERGETSQPMANKPASPPAGGQTPGTISGGPRPQQVEAVAFRSGSVRECGGRVGRRFADFQSFITGPSNQLARTSAELVVKNPGVLSPLVLWGPTGVGKTHLLEAIWTAFRRGSHPVTALYLTSEQFTSSYLEALRGSGLPSFRRKYRGVDVLLIDDLQFFVGKKATQVELLYTIDALQQAGRQLVFASTEPPRELRDLLPDLAARLDSGVVCRIEPPDYETRLKIVAHQANRLGLCLPSEVCQFVASHFRRHAWELSGAVCRLHAASCGHREPVTVEFARQVLADMLAAHQQVVQLSQIQKAVCEVFQIDPAGLCGPSKGRQFSYPRMLAMWLARKYTRAALGEIGQFFGRRSHSTVLSAQKQVDRWLQEGRSLRMAGGLWNPEEAIRQVEKYLRVG